MNKVKVKICCISSVGEAAMAINYGADAIGLVSEMPSGPGVIPMDLIADIVSEISQRVDTFLLTSAQEPGEIIAQHRRCQTSTIQLVDEIREGAHEIIKQELPDVNLVQVIHVRGEDAIQKAKTAAPGVEALLLDSGNQSLEVKKLGGTGETHNWEISREIVQTVDVPVFLAGGLKPANVQDAVQKVKPYGIDVCSGLRSEGKLDEEKLDSFFKQLSP